MKKLFFALTFIFATVFCFYFVFFSLPFQSKSDIELVIAKYVRDDLDVEIKNSNLILGSSSIARLKKKQFLCSDRWLNRGVWDSSINDIILYLDETDLNLFPEEIILYVGENDISSGMQFETVTKSFSSLIDILESKFPNAEIHVLALKPSPKRELYWSDFERFNNFVKVNFGSIIFHEAEWNNDLNGENKFFLNDGIHLTDLGYEKFLGGVVNCNSSRKD